jgi:general secretion pathway protein G
MLKSFFNLIGKSSKLREFGDLRRPLANERGFSLGEIIIVIVIIMGIMAIVAPRIRDGQARSNVNKTRMIMAEVSTKIDEFNSECGKYPTGLSFLTDDDSSCKSWTGNAGLKHLLKDAWGSEFSYEVAGSGYNLKSLGADKKEGGKNFDKDIYSESSVGAE